MRIAEIANDMRVGILDPLIRSPLDLWFATESMSLQGLISKDEVETFREVYGPHTELLEVLERKRFEREIRAAIHNATSQP